MSQRRSKEFVRFTSLVGRLLTVPHTEIQKRIHEHREQAAKNPRKRGPKPKTG
jgi:hypothetical protein